MDNLNHNAYHIEIERKFLPDMSDISAPDLTGLPGLPVIQGYISTEPVIRVRRMGDECYLTVKTPGHLTRGEFEMPLTEGQFKTLWLKTEPGAITKIRYRIPLENGLTAELDVYGGELDGSVILEVEFPSETAARSFTPPKWFGREVTGDPRYSNNNLSRFGRPLDA